MSSATTRRLAIGQADQGVSGFAKVSATISFFFFFVDARIVDILQKEVLGHLFGLGRG